MGTPFPEVNDPDYSTMGLVGAVKGEERINWALLRIIDVLMRLSKDKENNSIKLSEGASRESLKKMGTSWNRLWFGGSHNRYEEFTRLLNDLASDLKPLIIQPEPGKPKLTGIKLYVYGFSRGAAAARTFVRWLSELLPPPAAEGEKTAAVPADRRDAAARQRGVSRAAGYGGLRRGGACGAGCRRAYVLGQTARWSCRMMKPMAG